MSVRGTGVEIIPEYTLNVLLAEFYSILDKMLLSSPRKCFILILGKTCNFEQDKTVQCLPLKPEMF